MLSGVRNISIFSSHHRALLPLQYQSFDIIESLSFIETWSAAEQQQLDNFSFNRVSADSLLFIQCHYRLLRGAQYRAIVIVCRESGRRAKWNAEFLFILSTYIFQLSISISTRCVVVYDYAEGIHISDIPGCMNVILFSSLSHHQHVSWNFSFKFLQDRAAFCLMWSWIRHDMMTTSDEKQIYTKTIPCNVKRESSYLFLLFSISIVPMWLPLHLDTRMCLQPQPFCLSCHIYCRIILVRRKLQSNICW